MPPAGAPHSHALALPSLSASVSTLAVSPLATSAIADSIVGWLWTLLLFLFPDLVAAGLCAPFLAAVPLVAPAVGMALPGGY